MSGQTAPQSAVTAALKAIDLLMAGHESEAFLLLAATDSRDLVVAHVITQKLLNFLTGLLIHKHGAATAFIMLGSAMTTELSGFDRAPAENKAGKPPEEPA